jgi:hypothetical protein
MNPFYHADPELAKGVWTTKTRRFTKHAKHEGCEGVWITKSRRRRRSRSAKALASATFFVFFVLRALRGPSCLRDPKVRVFAIRNSKCRAGLPAQRQARQAARDGARRSGRAVGAGFPTPRNAPLPGDARATAIIGSPVDTVSSAMQMRGRWRSRRQTGETRPYGYGAYLELLLRDPEF